MSRLSNVGLIDLFKKLKPTNLSGQFICLLLFALVLSQIITGFVLINERKEALTVLNKKGNLNRIISTVRILEESPEQIHNKILHAVSSENIRYWFEQPKPNPLQTSQQIDPQFAEKLKQYGIKQLVILESTDTVPRRKYDKKSRQFEHNRNSNRFSDNTRFEWSRIAIQLKNGRWLNVASRFHISPPIWPMANLVSISITGTLLIIFSILMIRRITKPIAELTLAAKKLGRGESVAQLKEAGPEDIKTATVAFNQMNEQLERYISDRTNMLAAVSHDLRTPITTLRLRTELMDEGPTQDAFLNTLDEMQAITDSTLSFIREDKSNEPSQLINVSELIESICDDLAFKGKEAKQLTDDTHFYLCRPVAIKRAISNLLENAVRYGKSAKVDINKHSDFLIINIKDEGPGIEESQLEEVFKPFVRLDKSRNQASGGMGLGLAITRSIIRNHGGDICLTNHKSGGLNASISLPIIESE